MPTLVRRKSRRIRKTMHKVVTTRYSRPKRSEFVLSAGEIDRINGALESPSPVK